GEVREEIRAAVIGGDEAETLGLVEPLDHAGHSIAHACAPFVTRSGIHRGALAAAADRSRGTIRYSRRATRDGQAGWTRKNGRLARYARRSIPGSRSPVQRKMDRRGPTLHSGSTPSATRKRDTIL